MNKNMLVLINPAMYFLLFIGLLFWAFVAFRLFRYAENHVGFNVLWAIVPFALLAILAAFDYFTAATSRFSLAILIFAALSCLAIFALYHFNILIPYELWLKRGQPSRPF